MDLCPRHRVPFPGSGPWLARARSALASGAVWLQGGDPGTALLALPGPLLASTWTGKAWVTHLGDRPLTGSPWSALESALDEQPGPWVGAATYELACDEGGLPRQELAPGTPGQHWTAVRQALHIQTDRAELWSWDEAPPAPEPWLRVLDHPGGACPSGLSLHPGWEESQHRRAVCDIQTCILEGEFYVANLCVPFYGTLPGEAPDFALGALARARPPFGAYLGIGDQHLLSLSMERLLARRGDRLWSQPIKGSAPLTGDPSQDLRAAEALAADPKERAEHTMILDLIRNDLGRVAEAGSVRVAQPMTVVPYPTVQHLVSTVEARARKGLGLAELLRAMLPGGSVTGAPKHAVCAHLAKTEAAPRGFYCGALGWISRSGDLDLALPIRTAQIQGAKMTYWTGGGITRRSDPSREWEELFLKTRVIEG